MKQQVDCYDNAMMESLWATLKKELVQHAKFKTRAQARSSIFEWIEVWYQRERSHSSLAVSCCLIGSLSPEQFEAARRVGSYDCVSTESGEVHSEASAGDPKW
jgi:putative transposase